MLPLSSSGKRIPYSPEYTPLTFFVQQENSLLSLLREGKVDLGSFLETGYQRLLPSERIKAFEIISDAAFVNKRSQHYPMLKARFNPNNQYKVRTVHLGQEKTYECFRFQGNFHIGVQLFLKESFIIEAVRIKPPAWVPSGN